MKLHPTSLRISPLWVSVWFNFGSQTGKGSQWVQLIHLPFFPLAPSYFTAYPTLWFFGWEPPCHKKHNASFYHPSGSLPQFCWTVSPSPCHVKLQSLCLIAESVFLTISPAISAVSLYIGFVKPQALILWSGSRTPRFDHCLKEPHWATAQTRCLFLCNPSGSSNSRIDCFIISCPLSYDPVYFKLMLCSQLQFVLVSEGEMSTEEKLAWELLRYIMLDWDTWLESDSGLVQDTMKSLISTTRQENELWRHSWIVFLSSILSWLYRCTFIAVHSYGQFSQCCFLHNE